ncbi:MAG: hypothetical protein HC925_00775 [Coleofasciculaceae cyanobacterium SM2_3_26]|nr:hypothetical protein [Coleofasciculaceae cyanobacterium SM2_3_26]
MKGACDALELTSPAIAETRLTPFAPKIWRKIIRKTNNISEYTDDR